MAIDNHELKREQTENQDQQPGLEYTMNPAPVYSDEDYKGADKLKDKVALITGGDSGIGRAVAIAYAKEGANVAIVYLNEDKDAQKTKELVEAQNVSCLLIKGDVAEESFAQSAIEETVNKFGQLDILVNNAAEQHVQTDLTDISTEQFKKTFDTNFFSFVYFSKAALHHLPEGGTIINTASVNPYVGAPELIDYTSTKGAIVAFTRSLANSLAEKNIRVNTVAPGPIWTPLIPATMPKDKVETFGESTPLGRPGQPSEFAGPYVLLASKDGSYITGQTLHVNGGMFIAS